MTPDSFLFNFLLFYQRIVVLIILCFSSWPSLRFPRQIQTLSSTGYGFGRGHHKRNKRRYFQPNDVFQKFRKRPDLCFHETGLKFKALEAMFSDFRLRNLQNNHDIETKIRCMGWENKIVLFFIFLHTGCHISTLSNIFNISINVSDKILYEMSSYVWKFLSSEIPNSPTTSNKHSCLDSHIKYVVDGTITRIYRPLKEQHRFFRGDKKCHFINTHLLIDFDGKIIAVATGFAGHLPDNFVKNCSLFQNILDSDQSLALGDHGYCNVPFVVAGLDKTQLNTLGAIVFDYISREEQRKVEHANSFVKKNFSISKMGTFRGRFELLVPCVMISCALVNWKKRMNF